MKLIGRYKELKKQYPKSVILIKSGVFYEIFNEDAIIINYIFDYKVKKIDNDLRIGFPSNIIKTVENKLLELKLSYVIIDKENKYISKVKKNNDVNYDVALELSDKSYNIKKKIDNINYKLHVLESDDNIEEIIGRINEFV